MLLTRVQGTLDTHRLLKGLRCVVVGVSGGADSVALLHALNFFSKSCGIKLVVAHLNHGLRGKAARKDQVFVQQMADRLGWPCVTDKVKTKAYAKRKGLSVEQAARQLRHDFFRNVGAVYRTRAVALAHTRDDQAETVLMRLARGSSTRGLGGMHYLARVDELTLLRPMLDCTHAEAVAFLKQFRIAWREDKTNQSAAYARNRVRHKVLPALKKHLNPKAIENIHRSARLLREDEAVLQGLVDEVYERNARSKADGLRLSLKGCAGLAPALQRRLLIRWLEACGVDPGRLTLGHLDALVALIRKQQGMRQVVLGPRQVVQRVYGELRMGDGSETEAYKVTCAVPGSAVLPGLGLQVQARHVTGFSHPGRQAVGRFPVKGYLSARKLDGRNLVIRSRRPGDRLWPLGMKGSKKLQDIFVDLKVARCDRRWLPLVACGDEIVWIPGYQVARGWEVPSAKEKAVELTIGP